jgi:hypothetical protein
MQALRVRRAVQGLQGVITSHTLQTHKNKLKDLFSVYLNLYSKVASMMQLSHT